MLKKKAFNKIFFTTIIFFIVFVLYNFKLVSSNSEEEQEQNVSEKEIIYTLNDDDYISKTEVYVGKVFTLEDKIKEKLEIMVKDNNKNALLPSYFKPILPKNTKVENVVVEDSLVKVYFSKELNDITEDQSEKMIEAIIYTITDENVLGIEIYVDNKLLKYVPHTKRELPTLLTKDFGINKTYEVNATQDINKIVMTYYTNCDNSYCEVPVTKYINDDREKLEIIFDNLSSVMGNNLISLIDDVKLSDYKIDDKSVTVDLNKDVSDDEISLIAMSIFNNYDIEKINILVNNQKKMEKTKKNIEK